MASETVTGLTLRCTLKGSVVGANGVMQQVDEVYEIAFQDGNGNNQIGAIYKSLARPLNVASETLDMDGLVDFKGSTMTDNTKAKLLWFRHKSTTAGEVMKVGGGDFAGATGPVVDATDKMGTGPDGLILMVNPRDGWTITATTKDGLPVELTGNSTYDVIAAFTNT